MVVDAAKAKCAGASAAKNRGTQQLNLMFVAAPPSKFPARKTPRGPASMVSEQFASSVSVSADAAAPEIAALPPPQPALSETQPLTTDCLVAENSTKNGSMPRSLASSSKSRAVAGSSKRPLVAQGSVHGGEKCGVCKGVSIAPAIRASIMHLSVLLQELQLGERQPSVDEESERAAGALHIESGELDNCPIACSAVPLLAALLGKAAHVLEVVRQELVGGGTEFGGKPFPGSSDKAVEGGALMFQGMADSFVSALKAISRQLLHVAKRAERAPATAVSIDVQTDAVEAFDVCTGTSSVSMRSFREAENLRPSQRDSGVQTVAVGGVEACRCCNCPDAFGQCTQSWHPCPRLEPSLRTQETQTERFQLGTVRLRAKAVVSAAVQAAPAVIKKGDACVQTERIVGNSDPALKDYRVNRLQRSMPRLGDGPIADAVCEAIGSNGSPVSPEDASGRDLTADERLDSTCDLHGTGSSTSSTRSEGRSSTLRSSSSHHGSDASATAFRHNSSRVALAGAAVVAGGAVATATLSKESPAPSMALRCPKGHCLQWVRHHSHSWEHPEKLVPARIAGTDAGASSTVAEPICCNRCSSSASVTVGFHCCVLCFRDTGKRHVVCAACSNTFRTSSSKPQADDNCTVSATPMSMQKSASAGQLRQARRDVARTAGEWTAVSSRLPAPASTSTLQSRQALLRRAVHSLE